MFRKNTENYSIKKVIARLCKCFAFIFVFLFALIGASEAVNAANVTFGWYKESTYGDYDITVSGTSVTVNFTKEITSKDQFYAFSLTADPEGDKKLNYWTFKKKWSQRL